MLPPLARSFTRFPSARSAHTSPNITSLAIGRLSTVPLLKEFVFGRWKPRRHPLVAQASRFPVGKAFQAKDGYGCDDAAYGAVYCFGHTVIPPHAGA